MNRFSDLQLRGAHTFFMGDRAVVYTDLGYVRMNLIDAATGLEASSTLTPDQADELARDLKAYAEATRRARNDSKGF